MTNPSSWFVEQLALRSSKPKKFFTIGGSDYSARVTKWPKFNRTATQLKSVSLKVPLANVDGALNQYYENTYLIPSSANLELGFIPENFPIDDNLVGFWPLDSNFLDVTTNSNNGSATGTITFSDGVHGEGAVIDGSSGTAINVDSNSAMTVAEVSISSRVKFNATSGTQGIFEKSTDGTVNKSYLLFLANNELTFRTVIPGSGTNVDIDIPVNSAGLGTNDFHHIVATFDGTTKRVYVDNQLKASAVHSYTLVQSNGPCKIGALFASAYVLNGIIDEVRIYDKALNAVEINAVYNNPGARPSERLKLYSGFLKDVGYSDKLCNLKIEDKLSDFHIRVVGEGNNPIQFSSGNPAQHAWTLCTCYGGLSSIESSSNPDIDYAAWDTWSNVFSDNGTVTATNYEGEKITEALSRLAKYTDSKVFVNGDGKLVFKGFNEVSSVDITLNQEILKSKIDVETKRLVNKQIINWDYSVDSDFWQNNVFDQASTSVNTFGLHENIIEDETIWYTNSVSAVGQAQRLTSILQYPPKRFVVDTGLAPAHMEIGNTMRLVDSFFNITSTSGWTITKQEFDLQSGSMKFEIDEAIVANAFYLDISDLDGDDLLL